MISYSVLIFLLLVECCPASKRAGQHHYDRTPPPRSNEEGGRSTHISEFTDPATGLNPFIDLEEGRTGETGRDIVEEETLRRPLSDSDLQLVEGGPDDRGSSSSSQWNHQGLGSRWENFNNKQPHRMIPMSPASDVNDAMGRQSENGVFVSPAAATETSFQVPPDVFISSTKISGSDEEESDYYSHRPVSNDRLEVDYTNEYPKVEEAAAAGKTVVLQEDSAHLKKEPISKNVLISAAITGASVAVIALLLAICWWKQKMKRSSTRGNATITENNIESVISEKTNTNADIHKKSISA